MTTPYLAADITADEGCRLAAYPDPVSGGEPWTIGVGHTGPEVHQFTVWTQSQADAALASDIARCERLLTQYHPWWQGLDDVRQDVLVMMAFQLGIGGLDGFPRALAAIRARDWTTAKAEMLDSEWARQTPSRAEREAKQMLTGVRSRAT